MLDRVPTRPGRIKLTSEADGTSQYFTLERADEPSQEGTPLNKETLLSDATATAVANASGSDTPETVDDALKALSSADSLGKRNYYTFTSSTTWTAPKSGKAFIIAEGGGGGGGGAARYTTAPYYGYGTGGGGGSGYVNAKMVSITEGDTFTIVCGAGGSAGAEYTASAIGEATAGGNGGDTSITRTVGESFSMTAAGGEGGKGGRLSNGYVYGGAGGAGGAGGGGGGAFAGSSSSSYTTNFNAYGGNGGDGQYGGGGGGGAYATAYNTKNRYAKGGNGGNSTTKDGGGGLGGWAFATSGGSSVTSYPGKGGNSAYAGGNASSYSAGGTTYYGGWGGSATAAGLAANNHALAARTYLPKSGGTVNSAYTRIIADVLGFEYAPSDILPGGSAYSSINAGAGGKSVYGYLDCSLSSTTIYTSGGLGFGKKPAEQSILMYDTGVAPGLHGGYSDAKYYTGTSSDNRYLGGAGGSGLFGIGALSSNSNVSGGGGGFLDAGTTPSGSYIYGTGEGGGGGVLICLIAD